MKIIANPHYSICFHTYQQLAITEHVIVALNPDLCYIYVVSMSLKCHYYVIKVSL